MFWQIALKDLRLLLGDRRTLVVLLAFPMIFITIIGLTTGKLLGWKNSNLVLRIAYVDQVDYESITTVYDSPELDTRERKQARNIVSKVINSLQSRQGVMLLPVDDEQTARETADLALIIGPDFYTKLLEQETSDILSVNPQLPREHLEALDVALVGDAQGSSTHALVEQFIWDVIREQAGPYIICQRGGVLSLRIQARCVELQAELDQPPVERLPPIEESDANSTGSIYDEVVPSFTVMFVFFIVSIMAHSFLHERDLGTLRRLRLAPISPVNILVGKTLPFFILSLVQTALLFLFGRVLFDMPWGGQPLMLVPVAVATSLAATAMGLLVATVVRSDAQVSAYANLIVISLAGISGCFLPRDWLSDQMRTLSLATPHAWALIAYDDILARPIADAGLVARCCGMLLLFATIFFVVGVWRFRNFR